jgi:uptake hydrogenase large subunit
MSVEGRLEIELYRDGPVIDRAEIASSRPLHISRLFVKKSANDAVQTTSLIFSVCAMAQSCAAAMACEGAMGYSNFKDTLTARNMIVSMETAREHVLHIALDWPNFIATTSELVADMDIKAIMKQPKAMEKVLFSTGQAFEIGARPCPDHKKTQKLIGELEILLQEQIFGEPVDVWKNRQSLDDLENWADTTNTLAARFILNILRRNWSDLGAIESAFLPIVDESEMFTHITGKDSNDFTSQALWKGETCETGPLTRQKDNPLIRQLLAKYQSGLLTRLVARLAELANCPDELLSALDDFPSPDAIKENKLQKEGFGLAQIEAARGRLVHLAKINNGIVENYTILAPTEWNFHPKGPASCALKKLDAENDNDLKIQAELLIKAIDPCVGFEVKVR